MAKLYHALRETSFFNKYQLPRFQAQSTGPWKTWLRYRPHSFKSRLPAKLGFWKLKYEMFGMINFQGFRYSEERKKYWYQRANTTRWSVFNCREFKNVTSCKMKYTHHSLSISCGPAKIWESWLERKSMKKTREKNSELTASSHLQRLYISVGCRTGKKNLEKKINRAFKWLIPRGTPQQQLAGKD